MQGNAHVYGDHVDTDAIIPARYLNTQDPKALASHCMEDIDAEFAARVVEGDLIVAGRNFGCGSSREHAPLAIKTCGVQCVIAESFARIFYRNAINIGLPLMECPEAARDARAGDKIQIDIATGVIENLTRGASYRAAPFPPFMQELIRAGGLVNYTRERMRKEGNA